MVAVREWFTNEMQRLGFAGLEGVYDYLETMSDEQSLQYLQSLLGPDSRIQSFANAYIQNRALGNAQSVNASALSPASDESLTMWASSSDVGSAVGSKKTKRGRGKGRGGGSRAPTVKREEKALFAHAVTGGRNVLSKSEQAIAVRNSPVEVARQKVRDYRKSRKPVNCIRCGKIESLVREDGACSFCGAALFSIWEKKERPSLEELEGEGASSKHSGKWKELEPVPVVFGRYVFPLKPGPDGVMDASLPTRDIAGKRCTPVESGSEDIHAGQDSSGGFYRNPAIGKKELDTLCRHANESLKKFREVTDNASTPAVLVQGKLQIDDVAPSVCS